MNPTLVFQAVSIDQNEPLTSIRLLDGALKKSSFPFYLAGGLFPFFRKPTDWPGIKSVDEEIFYTFAPGPGGELNADTKLNMTVRIGVLDQYGPSYSDVVSQAAAFASFCNRVIQTLGTKAKFKFSISFEGLANATLAYEGFPEEAGLDTVTRWALPDQDFIVASAIEITDFPVGNSEQLSNMFAEVLADLAFNIRATRYSGIKGYAVDRLRLQKGPIQKRFLDEFNRAESVGGFMAGE